MRWQVASAAAVIAARVVIGGFPAAAQDAVSPYIPVDPRTRPFLETSFSPELDTQVPLDLEFMGDDGVRSTLRDRMVPDKPVILAIVYYRCPTMCNLILNGLVATLKDITRYEPGKDFTVIAVSFDHEETHVTARAKKEAYLREYGDFHSEGWHFMVGNEPEILKLTRAVNFGFKYDPVDNQYAHGSGLLVLTPDGRISRFLPGVMFPLLDTRLALVEAGEGKIGTLSDRIALLCYDYNPETGKYGLLINRVIIVACFITIAAVAWLIIGLLRLEKKQSEPQDPDPKS